MRLVLPALLPLLILDPGHPVATQAEFDHEHTLWSGLLEEHVDDGLLDYRALKRERGVLDRYLTDIAAVTPEVLGDWESDEQFAFYANAYNAHAARLVLDAYPLKSINDLSTDDERVWDRRFIPLGAHLEEGRELISLDELENAILRPRFEDARVHVAVNCASRSCPPLDARAIRGEGLDEQLDRLMRAFLADGERNRFDREAKTVHLSQIFNWFESDFVSEERSLVDYLAEYGPGSDLQWLDAAEVSYLEYDWSLNDVDREND